MKSIAINKDIQMVLRKRGLSKIIDSINSNGGRSLLVGGAVRDLFLGCPIKDIDIEVHSLSLDQLESILNEFGTVSLIGKSFGVLRLHGLDVDWSLPRRESSGRKPMVEVDPSMTLEDALGRRDLTINAMAIDLRNNELIDPFNGLKDLNKGVLRAANPERFTEDPLRFYRVMQFIGRFEMHPDKELNKICSKMDISKVSIERIEAEFDKLFLKSKKPSLSIDWLDSIDRLEEVLPEVANLKGVEQSKKWHPEGGAFEHTKQVLDAAANLKYDSEYEKLIIMYSALCHDLGKAVTTIEEDGKWRSLGHANAGVALANKLLKRITNRKDLIKTVTLLVKYHELPPMWVSEHVHSSVYKKWALKLAPYTTLKMLGYLAWADRLGRNPKGGEPFTGKVDIIDKFLKNAEEAQVLINVEPPILLGRDLLKYIEPGPEMGKMLKLAYKIQLEENIKDKDKLLNKIIYSVR